MKQITKKNDTEKDLELKTLEDVDKSVENKTEEISTEKSELELENEQLKKELDEYKGKYTKAVEVNNQLYQRLTSPVKPSESALQGILNRF